MKKSTIFIGLFVLLIFLACAGSLYAQETSLIPKLTLKMAIFVFQLSIILFAAHVGGSLVERIHLPAILGEVIAGMIIGPYFLGQIPLPGFSEGLFPFCEGLPVSLELYSFTTIASIILLFLVGLETDIETFLSFSLTGFIVGLGGLLISFVLGVLAVVVFSPFIFGVQYGFTHPMSLFLGVISIATSVSISARILSEKRKMGSPEGVTILSAAVIDDVLGIIVLAIVVGIVKSGHVAWGHITLISLKAIVIWLGFTIIGLVFSRNIGEFLKKAKDRSTIAIMSFACALFLAGIFEKSGLAMIIGAYIMGLSLSKTDLSFIIQENIAILSKFFVPVFFCVMGMLVDLPSVSSGRIILFGLIYVVAAVLGKVLGCSIPSLFLNFNMRGALRIGVGMIPRGEVALIIAGIGLSSGIIGHDALGIVVIMMFATLLMTPPLLSHLLKSKEPVLRKAKPMKSEHKLIVYPTPNPETAKLILREAITAFEEEGFYVHRINLPQTLFQIRKNQTFITLNYTPKRLVFDCLERDVSFIHTVFYEVIAELERMIKHLQTFADKGKIGKKIFAAPNGMVKTKSCISCLLNPHATEVSLKSDTKQEIIEELLDLLIRSGQLEQSKRKEAFMDLLEREASVSTGMQDGVALPHAKTSAVNRLIWGVGIKKEGIGFDSLDKKPSNIFVIILSPKGATKPHLQFMSEISRFLIDKDIREELLSCTTNDELYLVISAHSR